MPPLPAPPLPAPRTPAGRRGLDALLADPRRAMIALDYDGTLAPVVDNPQDAVPQAGALDALTRLAPRLTLVLVTGREADVVVELAGLAALPGLQVLGQYGAQRWRAGRLDADPPTPGLQQARAELPGLASEQGATVEDKGLSLVVHTRGGPDPAGALDRLRAPLSRRAAGWGLEVHAGRLVLELRPPGHDKGTALQPLLADRSAVLFAGDDVGDVAAFDEVERARGRGLPGLLVCSDSDEAPERLRAGADLVVEGPAGVVRVLTAVADALRA